MKHKAVHRSTSELLNIYRQYLLSKISKVRILGEANERELKNVFVDLSIIEQHIGYKAEFMGMMDSIMRQRFDFFPESDNAVYQSQQQHYIKPKRYIKPDEILGQRAKAIITGAPGCGKTTLLKYLALKAEESAHLVVWLELKGIDEQVLTNVEKTAGINSNLILQDLWLNQIKTQLLLNDAEAKQFSIYWRKKFKVSEVVVLLDGFDEVQNEIIEKGLNKCVREFTSSFGNNTLLISTRPYAKHKLGKENLQELEIEPFNSAQITAFLNFYHPDDDAVISLLKKLKEQSSIRELLYVPLLLGIILRLHKENRFTGAPLELYEAIVDDLVSQLDRSKSVIRQFIINDERVRLDFLKFLAFERLLVDELNKDETETNRLIFSYDLLKQKTTIFLTQEGLSYNARDLANDVLATPVLREISAETFAFAHLTLQEYLAAHSFSNLFHYNELEGLKIFCRAYHNPIVVEMEVLPMLLGLSSKADKLYEELELLPESITFANLRLRGRGLKYRAKISQERLTKVLDYFVHIFWSREVQSEPYFEIIAHSFVGSPDNYLDPLIERIEVFLDTPYDYYRARVAEACRRIGGEKAISLLQSILKDKVGYVRAKAANWLGQIGDEKSTSFLVEALNDADPEVIKASAEALVNINFQQAISTFFESLNSESAVLRSTAISWLGLIGKELVLDIVKKSLADSDRDVRLKTIETLGVIGGEQSLSILVSLLQESDFGTRRIALRAIAQCGDEKAVEILLEASSSSIGEIRQEAIDGLVKIDGKRFIKVFISALRDLHPYVRWHAAKALDLVADREALPALLAALENKNLSELRSNDRGLIASSVIQALRHFKDEEVFQTLIKILQEDKGSEAGGLAALVLAEIGNKRALQPLIMALKEPRQSVRIWASKGLGIIGEKEAAEGLIEVLNLKDSVISQVAIEALGKIKNEIAVESLILALQNDITSKEAAIALRNFKGEAFVRELVKAFDHENSFVRRKAVSFAPYHALDLDLLEAISRLIESEEDSLVSKAAIEAKEKFTYKLELLGYYPIENSDLPSNDNESRELILVGEVIKIVAEAGHIFRPLSNSDWGIDGEIEFKNDEGEASGRRIYLQLKSGDSYLYQRKRDGKEIFTIKNPRHAKYWQSQAYPVFLAIRNSRGQIRWMNVKDYLMRANSNIKQIEFQGESFNQITVNEMYKRLFGNSLV